MSMCASSATNEPSARRPSGLISASTMSFSTNSRARRVTIGTSLFSAGPLTPLAAITSLARNSLNGRMFEKCRRPDLLGLLLGDLLDVDAADRREDHHRLLAGAVPDDAGVVLLLDLRPRVDEHPARHVPVDLEREDLARVRSACSGVSANFTPPAFMRPPVRTWDLITVGPPIRRAISPASSASVVKP